MNAVLDPFAEAVGRVVIAGRRLDGAIGVLTAYALGDRSGRVMPGTLESLLRWWGDYIGHVTEPAVRTRHQAAHDTAVELGRRRDDTINALGRIAVTELAVLELRDLALATDAHVEVVLDLADQVRDSGWSDSRQHA